MPRRVPRNRARRAARPVDVRSLIRDFAASVWGRVMTFKGIVIGAGIVALASLLPGPSALAQQPTAIAQPAAASKPSDLTAQRRVRRQPTRVRVYRSFPGPNSQRVCNARYVQEYRPSGTVIVPVMNCYWSG